MNTDHVPVLLENPPTVRYQQREKVDEIIEIAVSWQLQCSMEEGSHSTHLHSSHQSVHDSKLQPFSPNLIYNLAKQMNENTPYLIKK